MLPEFEVFLTPERMALFWESLKYFLFYVGPVVMIVFAIAILGGVIDIIKKIFGKRKDDDDDDDYEVFHY